MADRDAIRNELMDTRTAFHQLLDSLSPADWKRRSGNAAWTVGQLMWHLAWGAGFIPTGVENAKKGRGFNPPAFIADRLNVLATRWGSRKATPRTVAPKYDAAHAKILAALDGVQHDEWTKGARNFGEYMTIEALFHSVAEHLDEHGRDIRRALGRA